MKVLLCFSLPAYNVGSTQEQWHPVSELLYLQGNHGRAEQARFRIIQVSPSKVPWILFNPCAVTTLEPVPPTVPPPVLQAFSFFRNSVAGRRACLLSLLFPSFSFSIVRAQVRFEYRVQTSTSLSSPTHLPNSPYT